ncbi:hypothetical protein ACFQ06_16165, partial [Tessaracoccus lubricantis]|uniref:hypothetical protein n=1 Tax=Tessaracoccus lubricantis TaxID=545543 RepID=UPI0036257DEB
RRVTYLDLAHVDVVAAALNRTRAATVVVVDSADLVGTAPEREALVGLIERTRPRGAVILAAASADYLSDFPIDGVLSAPATMHEETRA